ncbi:MAG TPA: hypothetical protein VK054_04425, partial [Beutenbergiaceae bacterium]|nr:hypothetical protein [Beutenbergiaceae bacterium]
SYIGDVAVSNNGVYVTTSSGRSIKTYSLPGIQDTTVSLDSETGNLQALSADLGGVTRTETLTPRNILPRGRTDNEDYAPTVEIVRPAFTQGLHVFEDTTHRDLELPDPPDGTQAWTGTGNSLKQWTRINGQWVETPTQPAPADHTHSRVETTGTRWVGIAGSNQLSATTYAMAARSGVSQPNTTAQNQFPLVVARNDGSNEVRLERLTGTIHPDYLPPWAITNLQTYVATSFTTRDLMGYTDGHTITIRGLLGGGNITQGGMDITRTAIPTNLRPGPGNWQGACWVNGGHPSLAFVRENGTISVVQRSGGNVSGAQFVITYPRI